MPGPLTNIASIVGAGGSTQPKVIGRADSILGPVAAKLALSVDDLKKSLRQGTTLSKLAADRGVSHLDLVNTIKQGLVAANAPQQLAASQTNRAKDAPADDADVEKLAQDIATGTSPAAAKKDKRPTLVNEPNTQALGKLSTLLKMTPQQLVESLSSGKSLAEVASASGVPPEQALASVSTGMVLRTNA